MISLLTFHKIKFQSLLPFIVSFSFCFIPTSANNNSYFSVKKDLVAHSNNRATQNFNEYFSLFSAVGFGLEDIIVYYPFNGDATDASGNGLDASITGAVLTTDMNNNPSSAYAFDGTDDEMDIPSNSNFNFPVDGSFTISLWANFTDVSGNYRVMIGRDDLTNNTQWWIGSKQNEGVPICYFIDALGNTATIEGSTAINNGQWHQVAITRNGTTDALTMYIDGSSVANTTYDFQDGFTSQSDINAGYFNIDGNPGYYYEGKLDEIEIQDVALNATEIEDLYNSYLEPTSIKINTSGITDNYTFSLEGGGLDNTTYYSTGGIVEVTPVISGLNENILINFEPSATSEAIQLQMNVTNDFNILEVNVNSNSFFVPLLENYYELNSNELILKNYTPKQSQVSVSGLSGQVKIPGEDIVISGLDDFPDAVLSIYSTDDLSTPVRTITNPLIWDGTDNSEVMVPQGNYKLEVTANGGTNSFSFLVIIE